MKQRITPEQLGELTDEQKERLREWWQPEDGDKVLITDSLGKGSAGHITMVRKNDFTFENIEIFRSFLQKNECLPLLSIGQMWELLADFTGRHDDDLNALDPHVEIWTPNDMCDRLWEWVKIALQQRVDGSL